MKHWTTYGIWICLFVLLTTKAYAQGHVSHIFLGMPIGTAGTAGAGLSPKPGFAIGVEHWFVNKKGNAWSLGASYNAFKRKNEDLTETFEYLTVRAMPLVWNLDQKQQWYFEVGFFGNVLLHQESRTNNDVIDLTKSFQRTYLGPSGGFGVRIGQEGSSRILLGLRDDFGLVGVGKGLALKFNTVTLFAGLEI